MQCGENERARIEFDEVVISTVYLYICEDGLEGLISPLMVSLYTLPRVSERIIGILILIPYTVQVEIKFFKVLNLMLSWHCGDTNLSTSA